MCLNLSPSMSIFINNPAYINSFVGGIARYVLPLQAFISPLNPNKSCHWKKSKQLQSFNNLKKVFKINL